MILDERNLLEAVQILCELDADLARAVRLYGPPPWWAREPGFATLVWIILEQQVSLASAKATFSRLQATIPLTPQHFLTLDDATLKSIGFSRQKTACVRHLSQEILNGFDLESLHRLDDHEAKARLVKLKGIGNWTADVYLLMALRRPDAWPVGDLGLQVGMQELKGLLVRPAGKVLEALAEPWRPWRSAAARIVWQSYLSRRSS
jgi:DNA-3-methyladenine glycosylase II